MATLYCNFCGKSQHEVKKLIAASHGRPPACICDECVGLAVSVIDGGLVWPELIGAEGAPDVHAEEARDAP